MKIVEQPRPKVKEWVSELVKQHPYADRQGRKTLKRHYTKLVTKYKHYETNPHFEYMVDYIEKFSDEHPEMNAHLVYDKPIVLGTKDVFTATTCYFGTKDSIFGFCPKGDNEIYIVRIEVNPNLHGKGVGTNLMSFFLDHYFTFEGDPSIITLAVTGSVGTIDSRQETPIQKQKRFFEKFGFVQTSHWFSPVLPRDFIDGGIINMTLDIKKGVKYMKDLYKNLTMSEENDTI